ncbi:hypothetical protein ACEPAI_9598 [Sanghuangporus weigelae]
MSTGPDLTKIKSVRNDEDNAIASSPYHDISASNVSASQRLGELISLVPNEVLSEIFTWCCPTLHDRFCAPPMSPLTLSHVCQRWRKVVFSTPALWTYTSLGAPRHDCESATELMLLWIANSKTCPLVVDVDFTKFAAFKKPDAILPAVLELTELAADLKGPSGPGEMPLTVSVQPSVPVVFPYVSEEYYWTNDADEDPRHFAPNSLQLRVATRPCVLLGMDGHRDFGPYLVHLDLRDEEESMCLTMEEVLDILRVFPNLRHLAFRLAYVGDGGEPCVLSHLKTLAISWCEEGDPSLVLDLLSAPALQNFELDGQIPANFAVGQRWDSPRQFLIRSTPPLRTLDLYKTRCADIDLLGCLARCNNLERLWLEECSLEECLANDITEGGHPLIEAAQLTLGNVKTLGLVRCSVFNAQYLFQSLVVSGLVWRISALKGLYISDCNIHEGVAETLHLLRDRYEAGAYENLC